MTIVTNKLQNFAGENVKWRLLYLHVCKKVLDKRARLAHYPSTYEIPCSDIFMDQFKVFAAMKHAVKDKMKMKHSKAVTRGVL